MQDFEIIIFWDGLLVGYTYYPKDDEFMGTVYDFNELNIYLLFIKFSYRWNKDLT